jgi:hypothetical protein
VLDSLTAELQSYAYNNGGGSLMTEADDFNTGCYAGSDCANGMYAPGGGGGAGGFPVYRASTSDPAVTFVCDPAYTRYGCTIHNTNGTSGFSVAGHIPANAHPTCMDYNTCGDRNLAIIQPDGTTINMYGCQPDRPFRDGDIIGGQNGTECNDTIGGMVYADIVDDLGMNGAVTSGPNYEAEVVHYNEIVPEGAEINHALIVGVTCTAPGYVFPGSSDTAWCGTLAGGTQWNGHGVPEGTHFYLTISHAQIDELIASGTLDATMRGFYYGLHDYGGYILDTAWRSPGRQPELRRLGRHRLYARGRGSLGD